MDNWLKNNNVVKGLSVILAIMLWLVVSLDKTGTTPNITSPTDTTTNTYLYEAQIEPRYNDNQYIVSLLTKQVNVSLNATTYLLDKFRNQDNIDKGTFYVDLTNYEEGSFDVPVKHTGFPEGIEVNVAPKTIRVKIEAKQRLEMEVFSDQLGSVAEGFQAGEPIIKPKKVHITGSKEEIDKVAYVKAFINIEGADKPVTREVPLKAIDRNGNILEVDITPQTAEVSIPITSPFVTLPITYKINQYPPKGYAIESIQLNTKEISIYGPTEIINAYDVYPGPSLDLSQLTSKEIIQVPVPLVGGLTKTEPDFIELEVNIVLAEIKTFRQVPIKINGLRDGLKANIQDPANGIDIVVEGAPKILDQLDTSDIQVYVDLTNLPIGTHEVPMQINIPLYLEHLNKEIRAQVEITKE